MTVKHWLLRGLMFAVVLWMSWQLLFSDRGYRVYYQEQQERLRLQQELVELKARQQQLTEQILRFKNDPQALEELVRRELGYVYPDEYVVIMPKNDVSQQGMPNNENDKGPSNE